MAKRVAVIGAGVSGLNAIKSCLDEQLEPVCYERTGDIAGLWRYLETPQDGLSSVTNTTVINTSKEMMAFSNFPAPDDYPIYMHNSKVYEYFALFCKQFQLKKYIRFHTEVIGVKQMSDFSTSGRWCVKTEDRVTKVIREDHYDAVLICTGHHAEKHLPDFPGLEEFQGKVTHAHDYRNQKGYENKRVLIIGIGNSGGDTAVDLSKVTSEVYLSTRRGSWVTNRVSYNGMPSDMLVIRRNLQWWTTLLPSNILNSMVESQLNTRFDHAMFGLKPTHRFFAQHPMVNDELPNRIICGTVKIKADIERFTKTGVVFSDGSLLDDIDAVILATGYVFGFPFLDNDIVQVQDNKVELFKYVFPPDLIHPTLGIIGFVQPWGAINPISELQCRLATRVFKGVTNLPSKESMWEDIRKKQQEIARRYYKTQRHTIQVDWIPFMDELAELIGCKPQIGKRWLTDPKLAYQLVFGPCTPYQYRLDGPGQWDGARNAIMTQWQRTLLPLKTTRISSDEAGQLLLFLSILGLVCLALLLNWMLSGS